LLSCDVIELASESMSDEERRATRGIRIRRVTVSGDRATIRNRDVSVPSGIATTGADGSTVLRKVDGAWTWKLEHMG
jgi:hypothetical protein